MGRAKQEGRVGKAVVYVGLELGLDKWVACISDGRRELVRVFEHGSVELVSTECKTACRKWGIQTSDVVVIQEAGPQGFFVHRQLEAVGFRSITVDAASIEVPRRRRRAKTDRLDARALVRLLHRYEGGEKTALHVVRVPTIEQEDERRPQREIHRLKKEGTAATNRIRGLLKLHGVRVKKVNGSLPELLEEKGAVTKLPPNLYREVLHTLDRWQLIHKQINELRAGLAQRIRAVVVSEREGRPSDDRVAVLVRKLMRLAGVGERCAWLLVVEFFAWREFANRRQVGAAAGLTPTPWASSTIEREQGISKAGNPRVRWMMQEISLCWLRFQPDSDLTLWFQRRFSHGKRQHHIGVTALARRLSVELWRYLDQDRLPKGAQLKLA